MEEAPEEKEGDLFPVYMFGVRFRNLSHNRKVIAFAIL